MKGLGKNESRMNMAMKKGQYFSFDAIVAVVIFIIALTILSNYWFGVREVIKSQDDGMYRDALRMGDSFLTPGVPTNWNTRLPVFWQDIHQVGFTSGFEGNRLNDTKLLTFQNYVNPGGSIVPNEANYQNSRSMFRTPYDYYVNVTYDDPATGQKTLYLFGKNPTIYGANNTVRVDRIGSLNTSAAGGNIRMVSMHIMLWTNRSRT